MSRAAGSLCAAVVLSLAAACGSSSSTTATDAGSRPPQTPSWPPGPIRGATVLPLIAQTAAGGRPTTTAVPLDTPAEVAGFVGQFRGAGLGMRIRAAVRIEQKAPGHHVVGQVVAVGCDVPPHASAVANVEGDVVLVPAQVATPLQECLAPVTTVAIAVLPHQ